MSKTIIISNRLPVKFIEEDGELKAQPSEGGLATGLSSFYKQKGNIWLGWPGITPKDKVQEKHIENKLGSQNMKPVFLTEEEIELYYEGFSNSTIWPNFHYFNQYVVSDDKFWSSYLKVNQKFFQSSLEIVEPGDTLWIHDYHLLLLPQLLRNEFPEITIGFFQHIPFPSFEIFRTLPWRKELLTGMMGSDLIGFHTYDDTRHFLSAVSRVVGKGNSQGIVEYGNRVVKVDSFPMGIDYERYHNAALDEETLSRMERYRRSFGNQKLILSLDRLDYSKGIPDRLRAFEQFLINYPEYVEKISLVMVVVPSRDTVGKYAELKEEVDNLVGRINGNFNRVEWTPIHYFYRSLSLPALSAFYRLCDIAFITPLRDGMNLVCKEYVASRVDMKGVLILSEMAGASKELSDAILVNPFDVNEIMEAIHRAILMPESEQAKHMEIMQSSLKRYNVFKWAKFFIEELKEIKKKQTELNPIKWDSELSSNLKSEYQKSENRIIFLDYDGTLVGFNNNPEMAIPTEDILEILTKLSIDDKNKIVLISGRNKEFLEKSFGKIHMDMVAEHGVWLRDDRRKWQTLTTLDANWKNEIRLILEFYVDRTPGSFIEEKDYSMVWHFRKVETGLGELRSRELTSHLIYMARDLNLKVLEGNKVVEIKSSEVDKGIAAKRWLEKNDYDFILAMGDDWTDEDTFKIIPPTGFSIKVGGGISNARFSVENYVKIKEILTLLISN